MAGAINAAIMQDPTLAEAFRVALEAHGNQMRVAMPAKVLVYNSSTHKVTAQPLTQYRLEGGETQTLAALGGIPVIHPRSGAGAVYLPLAAGDMVTLLVSDRSLDEWKAGNGQTTLPNMLRAHDLADCWAIPGGYPDGKPPIQHYAGALEIQVASGTKVAITNGPVELFTEIDKLLTQLKDWITQDQLHNHIGNLGYPTVVPDPATLTKYIAVQTAILGVQTQLGLLKP